MKAQSTKHLGVGPHFTPGMLLSVLLVTTVAFGIIFLAATESVPVLTSSTSNAALITREAAKDAWLERSKALELAPYSVQAQEALKDAKMERGLATVKEAPLAQEAAKDAWLERGVRITLAAYSVERQEALKDAKLERGALVDNTGQIAHETAKDAWIERGARIATVPYSVERQEALKDAKLERGYYAAAEDVWFEGGTAR